MVKKKTIAFFIFGITLLYIISPWFFERKLLFNEAIALSGFCLIAYKRFKFSNDPISLAVVLLILWGGVHLLVSLVRMDSLYYYLRNSVIWYSAFAFFTGFFCFKYLGLFVKKIRNFLRLYVGLFLFAPISKFLFERFGMATLFPALFKNAGRWTLAILAVINIVYSFTYSSLTAMIIGFVYLLLLLCPSYRLFKQLVFLFTISFIVFFIYIQPNLNIISQHYRYENTVAIHEVMNSNPILAVDGNSTWRLVLWKQVIVDHFPANLFGIGFGTPMMKYFPVEDYSKLKTLPYVIGAHNSFIYLFGRLGLVYLIIIGYIYRVIFKEYFYHKQYYYKNAQVQIFWSFFALTITALFNPSLESPIYAAGYWMVLGFLAKAIQERRFVHDQNNYQFENPVLA